MKLTRTQHTEEIVMDMTPMIDVTFQLIIFFMLLMDMTTKDLEELVLPKAHSALPDIPDAKDPRPILNIISDGRILVKRELLYDPQKDDGYAKLKDFLSTRARLMKKAPIFPDNPAGGMAPDKPILIRADQSTPFKHIQKIMEICGLEGIKIWKVELAAGEMKDEHGNPIDPSKLPGRGGE
jgi:biopolymer transport protein ExbD